MRAMVLTLSMTALIAGCASLHDGAGEAFAGKYSCPEDRIVIKDREDLPWSALVLANEPVGAPAEEVRADPERLAKWQQDTRARRSARAEALDRRAVFQVTGCGHDVLLGCMHPVSSKGAVMINQRSCVESPGGAP